ncbi:MAG TPA: hypothetical protein VMD53_10490 [Rhizomicrobium sp.]|nr:hypothetical protein [Rhizomicrobium sp.]
MHALAEWRDFYVMIGTASGAIVGAAFIVVTLVSNLEKRALGVRGFITPIVVHLSSVLVGSAILTVPTLTPVSLAIILGTGGLGGTLYSIVAALRIWHMRLDADDRIFYVILPIIAYAAMATAAIMACTHNEPTFETLAVSLVALLIIGIRNAWDMASFAIMQGRGE